MPICPVLNIVNCDFSDQCTNFEERLKDCTVDNLFSAGDYQVLIDDATKNKYRLTPIEQIIVALNNPQLDWDVYELPEWDSRSLSGSSFQQFRNGRKIVPYSFTPHPSDYFHIRGSEFVSESHLQRLASKMTGLPSPPDIFRDAGILIDRLYTRQHTPDYVHNKTLQRRPLGMQPISRDVYCQQETFCQFGDVVLMAHPDVTLSMGDTLVVIDVKRAALARRSHKKQLLAYATAINQDGLFRDYVLINIVHANIFDDDGHPIFLSQNPRYDIMHATRDSPLIGDLEQEAAHSFSVQRDLLRYPRKLGTYWDLEQDIMYSGSKDSIRYLIDNADRRYEFLDPRFRRSLGPILVK